MKKENQIGVIFVILAPVLFLILAVLCPMFSSPKFIESLAQGSSFNLGCMGIPLIVPIVSILIAVYFFWKAKKA
ncbi:hypothetical protein KKG83_02165 [Candidatus Micrarchaeota archaeon]|nr:hypothetical protein [Candidatus Micrarchaeota archaeon]